MARSIVSGFTGFPEGYHSEEMSCIRELHACATNGSMDLAKECIHSGADVNLKDKSNGLTPLHCSFNGGHVELSLMLIKSGAILEHHHDMSSRENEKFDHRTSVLDKDGLSPMDALSAVLADHLRTAGRSLRASSVLCFGKADFTLGIPLPKSSEVVRPRRVDTLATECVVQVCASKHHSLAVTRSGEVYSWGHGRSGRLGHGDEVSQPEPTLIAVLSSFYKVHVIQVAAGENHTLVVTRAGELYSWGSDRFGQLGHGSKYNNNSKTAKMNGVAADNRQESKKSTAKEGGASHAGVLLSPRRVESLRRVRVVQVAAGDAHSMCCTNADELYAWGSNRSGQLGLKPTELSVVGVAAAAPGRGGSSAGRAAENESGASTSGVSTPRRVFIDALQDGAVGSGSTRAAMNRIATFERDQEQLEVNLFEKRDDFRDSGGNRNHHNKILQIVASHSNSMLLCRGRVLEHEFIRSYAYQEEEVVEDGQEHRSGRTANSGRGNRTVNEVYQWGHGICAPRRVHFASRTKKHSSSDAGAADGKSSGATSDFITVGSSGSAVNVTQVAAGQHHYAGVSSAGVMYTWGAGIEQLGHGVGGSGATTSVDATPSASMPLAHDRSSSYLSHPCAVTGLLSASGSYRGGRVVAVSAAGNRTCAVTEVGDLYTWGATDSKVIKASVPFIRSFALSLCDTIIN